MKPKGSTLKSMNFEKLKLLKDNSCLFEIEVTEDEEGIIAWTETCEENPEKLFGVVPCFFYPSLSTYM